MIFPVLGATLFWSSGNTRCFRSRACALRWSVTPRSGFPNCPPPKTIPRWKRGIFFKADGHQLPMAASQSLPAPHRHWPGQRCGLRTSPNWRPLPGSTPERVSALDPGWIRGVACGDSRRVAGMDTSMPPTLGWAPACWHVRRPPCSRGSASPMGALSRAASSSALPRTLVTYTWLSDEALISPFLQTRVAFLHHGALLLFGCRACSRGGFCNWRLTGLFFYLVSLLHCRRNLCLAVLALNVAMVHGRLFNAGITGFFAVGAVCLGDHSPPPRRPSSLAAFRASHCAGAGCGDDRRRGDTAGSVRQDLRSRLRRGDYLADGSGGPGDRRNPAPLGLIVNESWLTNSRLGSLPAWRARWRSGAGQVRRTLSIVAVVWFCVGSASTSSAKAALM